MHGITKPRTSNVARTLAELAPLIAKDLLSGDRGYIEAGHKLMEARLSFMGPDPATKRGGPRKNLLPKERDAFYKWAKREFDRESTQVAVYMQMARGEAPSPAGNRNPKKPTKSASWEDLLNEEFQGFDFEAYNEEHAARSVEDRLVKELIQKMVSTGYRVLAKEFHPDTEHGSTEAMARLNTAHTRLKEMVA